MVALTLDSPTDLLAKIAKQARAKRLEANLSQHSLSERSGVSLGVIKKFESSGKISVESLLKIAVILDSLQNFHHLFQPTPPEAFRSLDELLKQTSRKRGRK